MKLKSAIAFAVFAAQFLLLSTDTRASHWSECYFEVAIIDISQTHVSLKPRRFIRGDGSVIMDKNACFKVIGNGRVAIADVNEGIELLTPGTRLYGRWSNYGGMSPTGPVSSSGWSFTSIIGTKNN